MRYVSAPMVECVTCSTEYRQLENTRRLIAGLGKRPAPPDLALQLRIALSLERTKSYRRRWQGMWVRLENSFNAFMFPATAGALTAGMFFGMIIGFFGLPVNSSASS